jgi:4-alpha-glucanotransferase
MRVIQFAVESPQSLHWPHNYTPNSACYTGTHDNDTVNGWYATLNDRDRGYLAQTLGKGIGDPAWELIRFAWSSVSVLAIAPLQDLLSMGTDARMNKPGIATGNWRWRFRLDQFRPDAIQRMAEFSTLYNRVPSEQRKE